MRTTSTSEVEIDRTVPVLTDLKSLGVEDVFFVVCDGLKGLPDSGNAVFPAAIVETCTIHLICGTFRGPDGAGDGAGRRLRLASEAPVQTFQAFPVLAVAGLEAAPGEHRDHEGQ